MLSTSATMRDCEQFVTAVTNAGGRVPQPLANLLAADALLNASSTPADPALAIVKAAQNCELTAYRRDALVNRARWWRCAPPTPVRIQPMLVAAFYQELQSGAADEVLDSLRPQFDTAASSIAVARDLIPAELSAERFLSDAKPAALSAWQKLDSHLAVIASIGAIVAQFGCRTARFRLIEEYTLVDNFRLDDRPLFCCDGELEADSRPFGRPDSGHRTSPWFRTALKLHSVKGARDR
jgi:hypothetical protein